MLHKRWIDIWPQFDVHSKAAATLNGVAWPLKVLRKHTFIPSHFFMFVLKGEHFQGHVCGFDHSLQQYSTHTGKTFNSKYPLTSFKTYIFEILCMNSSKSLQVYPPLSFRIVIQEQSESLKLKASLEVQMFETTEGVVSFDSKSWLMFLRPKCVTNRGKVQFFLFGIQSFMRPGVDV